MIRMSAGAKEYGQWRAVDVRSAHPTLIWVVNLRTAWW
jgi:hypothetical protein